MKRVILFLTSLFFIASCFAQSIETGYVKEYNGKKAKTPLAGVELSVNGAPSTVSDTKGKFQLKFAVLKPGESVKYNEIYKAGYVIFNKDALDYWRISKDKKPFVIVMCKESAFRELKKKYYGIIEKSYREEYLRQKALAEQAATDALNLQTKLAELKKEYDEKLSNINTYVELFARIDHSEMDSIVGRALELIEAGKIDEGIKVYEELQLLKQVNYQLDKWQTGENMRQAAESMIDDAQRDLVTLADKLKQQIGLYEMGGQEYDEKRKDMMVNLITVYRQLNSAFDGHYNEELGTWICQLSDFSKPWADRETDYREAAALPSSSGLYKLANYYEPKAYDNNCYVDTIRLYLQESLKLTTSDSIRNEIEQALLGCGDFFAPTPQGDALCYKHFGSIDSVFVWPKTRHCYNKASNTLVIPEHVEHEGKSYTVVGIGPYAFYKNSHLKKVVLPPSIKQIYNDAFNKCDSLESVTFSPNIENVLSNAIPPYSIIELPEQLSNTDGIWSFFLNRWEVIATTPDSTYYLPTKKFLTELAQRKELDKREKAYVQAQLGYLELIYGDSINFLNHLFEARIVLGNIFDYDIAYVYSKLGDFKAAFDYLNSCIANNSEAPPQAYNDLAYFYAKGQYVNKNYQTALELIEKAIAIEPDIADFVDTKGEIYLMMGQRDSALCYWNKVLAINPEFDRSRSDLYKQLFPELVIEGSFKDNDRVNTHINDYLDLVQLTAKAAYHQQLDAFLDVDYDEILSIGVIAIEVLMNNKTEEQLKRYNPAYIVTALMWAIGNELPIRYDWWGAMMKYEIFSFNVNDTVYWEDGQVIDVSKLQVLRAIYNVLFNLNKELQSNYYSGKELTNNEKYIKDLVTKASKVVDAMKASDNISKELKGTIPDLLYTGKTFYQLSKEYNFPYEGMVRNCARILGTLQEQANWNE